MRATLLTLAIVTALFPPRSFAQENFNCFDTAEGGHRCACMGVATCSEMKQSGNCKSDPVCDQGPAWSCCLQLQRESELHRTHTSTAKITTGRELTSETTKSTPSLCE